MKTFRFSANTGFLWRELPFLDRIRKAGEFSFDAVEFHDEAQNHDLEEISAVLQQFGLPVVSLNTRLGETFGCAAIPGEEDRFRQEFDEAAAIADRLDARAIHVLAGKCSGLAARETYVSNLVYAAEKTEKTILIEPIVEQAVPGYFLNSLDQSISLVKEITNPRVRIMFDCYHIRHEFPELNIAFKKASKFVGHVQISSFPTRNEPFDGEINYSRLLPEMKNAGYRGFFGCEYIPENTMESGINWLETFQV